MYQQESEGQSQLMHAWIVVEANSRRSRTVTEETLNLLSERAASTHRMRKTKRGEIYTARGVHREREK